MTNRQVKIHHIIFVVKHKYGSYLRLSGNQLQRQKRQYQTRNHFLPFKNGK